MKFQSKPIPEHDEVPLADDGRWEKLVQQWQDRWTSSKSEAAKGQNDVYVLSVGSERDPTIRSAQLAEIVELVRAQGDCVVGQEIYHLRKPQARTLLGKGASRDIASRARECGAELLVIDAELTPSQARNLEDLAGITVCDREAVILNVFLRNARTRRARVQVEIAQLDYLRPRIRGIGLNMDQQMGGVMGSRGPGETASELMARKLDSRLAELKRVQKKLQRTEEKQRSARASCQRVALVGYTNAGKTSLMNALTRENLSARQMPFETLDTTSRALSRHGEEVILTDTVGFIRNLPQRLMASFESTLAEVSQSTLLLMVTDLSDYEWEAHVRTTVELVEKLGAEHIPRLYLFNKADLVTNIPASHTLTALTQGHPFKVVSSQDPESVSQLKTTLLSMVRQAHKTTTLFVPYPASEVLGRIYGECRILQTETCQDGLTIELQGRPRVVEKIVENLKELRA